MKIINEIRDMKNILVKQRFWYLLLMASILTSCGTSYKTLAKQYPQGGNSPIPDYANLNNWAAHPWKKNPSDSLPTKLRPQTNNDSLVDVFFLHPTTYTQKDKPLGWSGDINDALLNAKTDYSTILYQASIFNEGTRVFAPRYRQAHYGAYFPKTASDTTLAIAAFATAYEDVKNAFQYYLDHYHNNRPIIIAAHSQGTTHAKLLLKQFFDGKPLQNKLVVAYIVGIPVEPNYFTSILPCVTPQQIGCFCTWRTYKNGHKPFYVKKENYTAVVTNPITWNEATTYASRKANKGAVIKNFNKIVPHVADAQIADGVLWASRPRFFGSILYRTKNYHVGDFNLYYMNIRANVKERIGAYLKQ
jgi:hypothetical protein